jgi:hypothetical protein
VVNFGAKGSQGGISQVYIFRRFFLKKFFDIFQRIDFLPGDGLGMVLIGSPKG